MAIATQMMLMTYGALSDDPIKVRPSEPWAGLDTHLYDSEVSSITMPVSSSLRINGTLSMGTPSASDRYQNQFNRIGETAIRPEDVKVGGAYLDKWEAIEGTTKLIGVPEFIAKYMAGTPSSKAFGSEDFQNGNDYLSQNTNEPAAAASAADMDRQKLDMMNAYCHDDFWRTYGSDVILSLVTRIRIASDRNPSGAAAPLRPGNIIAMAGDDLKTLNICYITTVQHVVSVQDGRAYTSIQGMYTRGQLGIPGVYSNSSPVTSEVYKK
jgi:hypothetical protein